MVPGPMQPPLGPEYFLWGRDDMWTWADQRLIE